MAHEVRVRRHGRWQKLRAELWRDGKLRAIGTSKAGDDDVRAFAQDWGRLFGVPVIEGGSNG